MKLKTRYTLSRIGRSLIALALSPFIVSAIVVPLAALVRGTSRASLWENYGFVVLWDALGAALIALPLALLVHAALYALKRRGVVYYVAAGAVIGAAVMAWIRFAATPFPWRDILLSLVWSAGFAVVAWWIRRPDKDDLPKTLPESDV